MKKQQADAETEQPIAGDTTPPPAAGPGVPSVPLGADNPLVIASNGDLERAVDLSVEIETLYQRARDFDSAPVDRTRRERDTPPLPTRLTLPPDHVRSSFDYLSRRFVRGTPAASHVVLRTKFQRRRDVELGLQVEVLDADAYVAELARVQTEINEARAKQAAIDAERERLRAEQTVG